MVILIIYNKTDGGACRLPFKNTTEKFHTVFFLPPGGDTTLPGAPFIQLPLDERHIDSDTCRKTIDDAADSLAMTLPIGCQGK